ncbi:MAG: hypothetical protein ABW101_07805 [Candidatus Thiodiazotropha sp.]
MSLVKQDELRLKDAQVWYGYFSDRRVKIAGMSVNSGEKCEKSEFTEENPPVEADSNTGS